MAILKMFDQIFYSLGSLLNVIFGFCLGVKLVKANY